MKRPSHSCSLPSELGGLAPAPFFFFSGSWNSDVVFLFRAWKSANATALLVAVQEDQQLKKILEASRRCHRFLFLLFCCNYKTTLMQSVFLRVMEGKTRMRFLHLSQWFQSIYHQIICWPVQLKAETAGPFFSSFSSIATALSFADQTLKTGGKLWGTTKKAVKS